MEYSLLFLIAIFEVFFLFFLFQDPGGKGIVPYLLPDLCRPYFSSSSGVV